MYEVHCDVFHATETSILALYNRKMYILYIYIFDVRNLTEFIVVSCETRYVYFSTKI